LPVQLSRLPVRRGYPVPWFVAWLDEDGKPLPRGQGTPDFRVLAPLAREQAIEESLCWICGERMSPRVAYAFVAGPMCAVNRTSAEPPSHIVCADWSARACPFLARPHMIRREAGKPEDAIPAPGTMLMRNPGVALVWITKTAFAFRIPGTDDILLNMGEPLKTRWYAEGREATRAEIVASIDSGRPLLEAEAEKQGDAALLALGEAIYEAMKLVPEAA
jgi:hypothetical protein